MIYTARYYNNDIDLGIGTRHRAIIHAEVQAPRSQLWFCPICSNTYIDVEVIPATRFIAIANECECCVAGLEGLLYKTRVTLPGSILMEGYNTIDELSEEMLRRELLLELNAMKFLLDKGLM